MLSEVTDFCRVILLRHPELSSEDKNRAVGNGPASLSRRGQESVLRWLEDLADVSVDAIFTANQVQCVDAAGGLAATKGLEAVAEDDLRDQFMGEWQGREWEEIARHEPDRVVDFFGEFGEVNAPEGESLGAAIERFLGWWDTVKRDALGKTIVIVSTGAMVTGFTAALLGMRLSRAVCLNLPHAGMGIVDIFSNGARITSWNPSALDENAPV